MAISIVPCRRMIWEKDVNVLVMITNIKERGRVSLIHKWRSKTRCSVQVKCDLYWPQEGTETYGTIQVTLISTISLAYYVKRIFAIRCKANRKVNTLFSGDFALTSNLFFLAYHLRTSRPSISLYRLA